MGKLKAARKDYPAAIDCYKQAVEVVPMHDALVALGDLYQLTGKPEEAKKQFALVEATHQLLKANGVRGDMQIAQFYADHDRSLPEAMREEEAEIATRPNVYVEDTLAWCYYKTGRYQDAQAMIQKAMARHTPEALFKFHAGMIAAKLNQQVSARKLLYEALSDNPNFSLIYAPIAANTLKELGSRPLDAEQMPASVANGNLTGRPQVDTTLSPNRADALGERNHEVMFPSISKTWLVCLFSMACLLAAQALFAHPMGNFSINHYTRLEVHSDRIAGRLILDMAEIPTVTEMSRLDANQDGIVSDAEQAAYLRVMSAQLGRELTLTVNERLVALNIRAERSGVASGRGRAANPAPDT